MDNVHSDCYCGGMSVNYTYIEELRMKAGMTQEEAARKCGVGGGRQGWANVVAGRRDIPVSLLETIAKAFKVRAADLLK